MVSIYLDQWSKYYFIHSLPLHHNYTQKINSYLNFVYLWNQGISFGVFNSGEYANFSFLIINSLIISYILYLILKSKNKLEAYSLSIITGGALGNIIDRITRGAVFDFINIHKFVFKRAFCPYFKFWIRYVRHINPPSQRVLLILWIKWDTFVLLSCDLLEHNIQNQLQNILADQSQNMGI